MPVSVIIPFNGDSSFLRYFGIHLDDFADRLVPGTTICGYVVQNIEVMIPQDMASTSNALPYLCIIIPRGWVPPEFDLSHSYLWEGELPLNLNRVGYVSALSSTDPRSFHGPTRMDTDPQHISE
jgi:hypothetical protein